MRVTLGQHPMSTIFVVTIWKVYWRMSVLVKPSVESGRKKNPFLSSLRSKTLNKQHYTGIRRHVNSLGHISISVFCREIGITNLIIFGLSDWGDNYTILCKRGTRWSLHHQDPYTQVHVSNRSTKEKQFSFVYVKTISYNYNCTVM